MTRVATSVRMIADVMHGLVATLKSPVTAPTAINGVATLLAFTSSFPLESSNHAHSLTLVATPQADPATSMIDVVASRHDSAQIRGLPSGVLGCGRGSDNINS